MICVDEEKVTNADIKVMILGQETKGWWDNTNITDDIDTGMERYNSFFCNKNFYSGYGKSAFWKGFRFFQKELNMHYKDKKITYIWNNISKIGKPDSKTGVAPRIRTVEREFFPVVKREIEIIKPDIVIFLTGPDRDYDIRFHFPDVTFLHSGTTNTQRQLAKAASKDLPFKVIRTYHPSFYKGFNRQLKINAIKLLLE